jgi:hypothetical protein
MITASTFDKIRISNVETAVELYDMFDEPKRGILFRFKY